MRTVNRAILQRKWDNLRKNKESMERLILELMAHPAAEPEHLAQAHAMYADITARISEISVRVSNALRGVGEKSSTYACVCGCTEPPMKPIDHPSVYESCPNCGMV